MEVSLMPPPRPPPPRIAPVQSASERPSAAPSPRPRPSSAPSLSAPSAPRAEAPPAAPEPAIEYGPVGLQSSLSGKQGCDDPLNIHLTPEQAQVCANNLARLAREARRLAADLADKNRAAFDRQARCRALTAERGVPGSSAADETTGAIRGLGYNPSLKDCRAQDR